MQELDSAFFFKLLSENRKDIFVKCEREWFDEAGKVVFDFINKYLSVYHNLPAVHDCEGKLGIELIESEANIDFLFDEIRKRYKAVNLVDISNSVCELAKEGDIETAEEILKSYLIKEKTKESEAVDFFRYSERFDNYNKLINEYEKYFYPTPWESLNVMIRGWEVGTLNVLVAMTGVGKTWISCYIANDLTLRNKNVMYVSMEMSKERICRRLDSIRYKIPYDFFFSPTNDKEIIDKWSEGLDKDAQNKVKLYLLDKRNVKTVNDIVVFYSIYEPDVIIIDGGYRLKGRGKTSWEQNVSVVRSLQLMAEEVKVPVLVTTQLGDASERGKNERSSVRLWNVRFAKEWVIDPDVVIGIKSLRDENIYDELELLPLKVRDIGKAEIKPFRIKIDKNSGDFSEIMMDNSVIDEYDLGETYF